MSIQAQETTLSNLLYTKAALTQQNRVDCFITSAEDTDKYKRRYKTYDDAIKAVRWEIMRLKKERIIDKVIDSLANQYRI